MSQEQSMHRFSIKEALFHLWNSFCLTCTKADNNIWVWECTIGVHGIERQIVVYVVITYSQKTK